MRRPRGNQRRDLLPQPIRNPPPIVTPSQAQSSVPSTTPSAGPPPTPKTSPPFT
jgi:hypothetical protein